MTSGESGPPGGDADGNREKTGAGGDSGGERTESGSVAARAAVVSLEQLRRRQRRDAPETDPDPGDDPGPAAA